MAVPDWLSRFFQQVTFRGADGVDLPSRSNAKILGAAVYDDIPNDQTIIDLGTASIRLEQFGPTGTADDGPTIQTAINAVASGSVFRQGLSVLVSKPCTITTPVEVKTFVGLKFGPGTFTINAPIRQRAFSLVEGSPGTRPRPHG